jgi:hypothetical protein
VTTSKNLVDLGCEPEDFGTVTYNPVTRKVDVSCSGNQLNSLEGAPSKVGGYFGCSADGLEDVSALKQCKIEGMIYLLGPKADQERVTQMLRDQGYKGEIR